jgi:low temperature requirement protein LtrA
VKFRGDLVRPPRLRAGVGAERERHATWLELFYDLVFVAGISQLSGGLAHDYSPTGLLHFSVLFVPIWWAWIGHTYYLTRFDSDDLWHRLLTMAQILIVASLVAHVPDALGAGSTAFALSYAGVRYLLVAEYFRAGRHLPEVRPLTNRYIAGFGCAATLWVASVFVAPPQRFLLWYLAIVVDFLAPITAGQLHARFPPHLMHLPERFGLFTIIVIGEAVVGVVTGIAPARLTPAAAAAGVAGLIIAFALWWEYFEGVRGAGTRELTSRSHVRAYQQWIYAHLPLTMGIAAVAVGIRRVMHLAPHQALPAGEALILCASASVCLLALNTIFLSSYPGKPPDETLRFVLPQVGIALATAACWLLAPLVPGVALLALLAGMFVAQVVLSLRELPAG